MGSIAVPENPFVVDGALALPSFAQWFYLPGDWAIYLLATLRSFRGVGSAQMVRHGAKGYFAGGTVVAQGSSEIKMFWSAAERKLSLNGQARPYI